MANRSFSELSTSEKLLLPLNLAGAFVDLVFSIPVIGRLAKWVWNSVLTAGHVLVGLVEMVFWLAGLRPVKKMRIGFLVLSDQDGDPLIQSSAIPPAVEYIQQAFKAAQIEVLPAFPPPKRLSESGEQDEGGKWMRVIPSSGSNRILKLGCNLDAILQDLGLAGSRVQFHTLRQSFHASFQRISGYGAPVTIFVVEDLAGFGGCSMGWLSDYVTVLSRSLRTTAHELGHACNLLHHKEETNLMHPGSPKFDTVNLTTWQIALMRASRHVTII